MDFDTTVLILGCLALLYPLFFMIIMVSGIDDELVTQFEALKWEKERYEGARKTITGMAMEYLSLIGVMGLLLSFYALSPLWLPIKALFYPLGILLFEKIAKVKVLLGLRTRSDPLNSYLNITDQYSKLILEGQEIIASFGELGRLIFEQPMLIEAIKKAKEQDESVNIVFSLGPRVDPSTKTIFKLAREGTLKLVMSRNYYHNHFALITTKNGERFVIDEQIHDEAIWDSKEKEIFYDNKSRLIYIYKNREKLWNKKRKVFEERTRKNAKEVNRHPGLTKPQQISFLKTLIEFGWYNIFLGNVVQPISILFDWPIDFLYK